MAETHQGTFHSSLIKDVDAHDKDDSQLVQKTLTWRKMTTKLNRKLRNAIYPAHVESFWVFVMVVMAMHFSSMIPPFDLVRVVASCFPG